MEHRLSALLQLHLQSRPGCNGLDKDNCKTKWELFKFWELVHLILEVWQQVLNMKIRIASHVKNKNKTLLHCLCTRFINIYTYLKNVIIPNRIYHCCVTIWHHKNTMNSEYFTLYSKKFYSKHPIACLPGKDKGCFWEFKIYLYSTVAVIIWYILSSVCLRLNQLSQLFFMKSSFMQYMGLWAFSLPISLMMIVRYMYFIWLS